MHLSNDREGHGITDNEAPTQVGRTLQKSLKTPLNFRLILVCLAAASVGLPIAIISIAKILVLVGGTSLLLFARRGTANGDLDSLKGKFTPVAIVFALGLFGLSLLWTVAPDRDAFSSIGKYGKILMVVLIIALIRTRREAVYALGAFGLVQLFLLFSSWMLFMHLPVPWATSPTAIDKHAVFSSYLDQGIMTAVFAGLCWHFRGLVPGRFGQHCAIAVAILGLVNVFFVLEGRSGHVVAIALISLSIMWGLPRRYRIGAILLPALLLTAVAAVSPTVQSRIAQVKTEVQAFSFDTGSNVATGTSSGIRLHFWHRAIQSISEHPVLGAGVGSWSSEFNRIEKQKSATPQAVAAMGNPHQEYLLWGVQLGVPGLVLFFMLLLALFFDTLAMETMAARAAQSAIAALAIACLFNSTLYDALIGDFFCVVIGLLLAFGFYRPSVEADKPAEPHSVAAL